MKKFKIKASVPTGYQYSSILAFGMEIKKRGNGSYSAEQEFDDRDQAMAYLENRALMYADTEEEYRQMREQIETHGGLTLDACTAMVEEVESIAHTPGPWCVSRSEEGNLLIKPIPGQVVCEIDPTPEAVANAHLIAAAPEMLEQIKNLVHIVSDKEEIPWWLSDLIEEGRYLIEKAKGELP